jgi:hypothetical protein
MFFTSRILLLLPLLYLAFSSALSFSWALQTSVRALLAFVLLTVAVRLTASSPQLFTSGASEMGLQQMILEQSQSILAQQPVSIEHVPVCVAVRQAPA